MQSGSFSISWIPGKSEPKETETARKARYWPWLLRPYDHHYLQNLPMTPGWPVELVLAATLYPHYTLSSHLACWAWTPALPLETITLLTMWPTSWYKSSSSHQHYLHFAHYKVHKKQVQGVPYYWAHFVFVIFSGSRAHTEELFIAIG